MNEEEKYNGSSIERVLWKALKPLIFQRIREMEHCRSKLGEIRRDLVHLNKCRTTIGENAALELQEHEQCYMHKYNVLRSDANELAKSCLRWDDRYNRFVSISPWDLGCYRGYRQERYKLLTKNKRTQLEHAEYRLLCLEFGRV